MIKMLLLFSFATVAGCAAPKSGILLMAHGGGEDWNANIQAATEPLEKTWPIEIAFGMARADTIKQAVQRLENQGVDRIAVVRMFISGESFLEQTRYILGDRDTLPGGHHMHPLEQIETKAEIVLNRGGVGDSSLVDQILVDRVQALSSDPSRESVLILAHGPGDDSENERWLANMRLRAESLRSLGRFREVRCETLREDWAEKRVLSEKRIRQFVEEGGRDGDRVIVIPFRVGGFGPYKEVLKGLDYVADGQAFCPHPNMTRWIEETARSSLAR